MQHHVNKSRQGPGQAAVQMWHMLVDCANHRAVLRSMLYRQMMPRGCTAAMVSGPVSDIPALSCWQLSCWRSLDHARDSNEVWKIMRSSTNMTPT
jgi:hypothetical protein